MGKRQENGDEKNISHDLMAEQTRWAEWPNSAPMSYGLVTKSLTPGTRGVSLRGNYTERKTTGAQHDTKIDWGNNSGKGTQREEN